MKRKRVIFALALFLCFNVWLSANEHTVTLEISGVKINGGTVIFDVYNSEEAYKNDRPYRQLRFDATTATISFALDLNEGYYLFAAIQDENENGILDTRIFGIPREPFALSNYNGRGNPGNFNRLRVWIGSGTEQVSLRLDYFRM